MLLEWAPQPLVSSAQSSIPPSSLSGRPFRKLLMVDVGWWEHLPGHTGVLGVRPSLPWTWMRAAGVPVQQG